jgi:hypothetical protein
MPDEKAQYVFKVSDGLPAGVDDRAETLDPWIWLEPVDGTLSVLKRDHKNLGFVLFDHVSQKEAEGIADYLNKHIKALTIW